jgi:colanic acid/amylovoran biosynthesis glycosyltransferase
VRVAVFTNQFPSRVSTFFARDIAPLLRAGVDIEIFPFYPLDPTLWRYVPDILSKENLSRTKIHHLDLSQVLRSLGRVEFGKFGRFIRDTVALNVSAARFGPEPVMKTTYVALKAWLWAQKIDHQYDHILAYWGNYAASSAYIFHRLTDPSVPFSIFLHAGLDLYEKPVYLRQKLLAADKIITCSDFNRQFMREHFRDIYDLIHQRIYIHYHGVDLAEFRYQPDARPANKILAIGGFYEYKGFDYLLRAGQELSGRGIDYEMELVGDGTEADSLKSLAAKLKISDRVKFPGWVSPDQVPARLRNTTIFVHPSSRLADGVPNVIKEAMAVGTPVIASSVAGIPELLGNGQYGMLVPPRNVNALADAIAALLPDKERRLHYATKARRHAAENFDMWRNGQCLATVLSSTSGASELSSDVRNGKLSTHPTRQN